MDGGILLPSISSAVASKTFSAEGGGGVGGATTANTSSAEGGGGVGGGGGDGGAGTESTGLAVTS